MRLLEALHKIDYPIAEEPYDWALGRTVALTGKGSPRILRAQVRFGRGIAPQLRPALSYSTAELWEGLLPVKETWDALTSARPGPVSLGPVSISLEGRSWNAHYPPTEYWPTWLSPIPCYFASTEVTSREELSQQPSPDRIPVAKGGAPCFVNALSACRYWLDLHGAPSNDSALGVLEVLLDLPSGHVSHVEEDREGRLRVHLVPGTNNEVVEVIVAWDDAEGPVQQACIPEADCATLDCVPSGTFAVYVLREGSLIARYQAAENAIRQSKLTEEKDVRTIILDGESESCEFKEISAKDPRDWPVAAWDKLLREICALANKRGGHLLLGVTDDGDLVGMNATLDAIGSQDGARSVFESLLRRAMQERLEYRPQIDFVWTTMGDSHVLAMEIAANGPGKVCALNSRIYVRRGSTSRLATVEELRALLSTGPSHWFPPLA